MELSTGETAEGIAIALARRAIDDGRTIWQAAGGTKTRSDGTYRFGGLADGDYAIYSEPTMESDLDSTPGGAGQRWGYASVYYPDAREPSGAAQIRVANGGEATANLSLTLEPFQSVTAAVAFPQGSAAGRAGMDLAAVVIDSAGHQVPYQTQFDGDTHTVEAMLPRRNVLPAGVNGSARIRDEYQGQHFQWHRSATDVLVGTVDFAVAGHAVPRLRIPLSVARPIPCRSTWCTMQRNLR